MLSYTTPLLRQTISLKELKEKRFYIPDCTIGFLNNTNPLALEKSEWLMLSELLKCLFNDFTFNEEDTIAVDKSELCDKTIIFIAVDFNEVSILIGLNVNSSTLSAAISKKGFVIHSIEEKKQNDFICLLHSYLFDNSYVLNTI